MATKVIQLKRQRKIHTNPGSWKPTFLAALSKNANVSASCVQASVKRITVYKARDVDEKFRKQWDEALDEATEILEAEARRRALAESDTMLIFLLKAHRPKVYRESYHDGSPIEINNFFVDAEQMRQRLNTIVLKATPSPKELPSGDNRPD